MENDILCQTQWKHEEKSSNVNYTVIDDSFFPSLSNVWGKYQSKCINLILQLTVS